MVTRAQLSIHRLLLHLWLHLFFSQVAVFPFFPRLILGTPYVFCIRGRLALFKKEDTVVVGLNCGFEVAARHICSTPVAKQELPLNQGSVRYNMG